MTYEERTNIESYLENLNNLVELKKALKRSLDRVEGDIEFSMFQIEEQTDDDTFASSSTLRSSGMMEEWKHCLNLPFFQSSIRK